MRAAVLHGKEDVRLESLPEPILAEGQVRVRIGAALTCGTDLKVFRRGYHARMLTPPCTFGHELAGVVSEVHPSVREWQPGDRVVPANSAPCGTCAPCRRGQAHLCDDLLFLNGAYAQSIVIPARIVTANLLRIPASMPLVDAALTEPLACVVQGIQDLQLKVGEHLAVIGAGPIGLMATALAIHLGASVTVVGRSHARLEAARRLGAHQVLESPTDDGFVPELERLQPDAVFEAVGKPGTWEQAIGCVRKGGRVNLFGGCPSGTTVPLDTTRVHYHALTLLASFHHTPSTIRRAFELIETGVVRAQDFVDGRTPLSQLPGQFRAMCSGNRFVKTLVEVDL
jgi:L-iditol 2-dehydrogenase